ncbi:FecCD family ABC transporter permease [Actinoalloteichus hymeniacidonis]|uniref:ABC-type Fe3+-siderophore transport system, permease component n=1 Tax=Actinoalloteichus hymeniacidonis TaxID=340345 RepID=A0AAC9MYY0_9PSEU|nr:iron ABC transporter permease [Actinoalloteichus hymeniacidonis]AOS64843.1 ABC-type Fe3+-siderophore transport system, permease component [Actinoalloteichus hymeniacidonis]MBB5907082.1 iron complex transport system permease protein [Actinoalloteichus hymeniacidonis]
MAQRQRATALFNRVPLIPLMTGLSVLLVLTMLLAVGVGSVQIGLSDSWRVVVDRLTGTPPADVVQDQILWTYRVPRVLLAALCGAGLSIAGVVLQAVVANPLADPYILGISSGASVGAVVVMTAGSGVLAGLTGLGVTGAAFLGALLAVVLVFALGQRSGRLVPTRLVLSGVAIGYVLAAVTSYLQLQANPNELRRVMFWMLGSVAGAQWEQLPLTATVVLISTGLLVLYGRRLNALVTGDESATALGVDVWRLRIGLLVTASLLTASLISVAGGIGFVGLMIPHLVRLTFGIDHRRLLPLAALIGASYLVLVDLLSRLVDPPNELPLGIFTAVFGAPFFIWLIRRGRGLDAT